MVTAGDVDLAAAEYVSATMVPVHESPGVVVDLTVQDLVDAVRDSEIGRTVPVEVIGNDGSIRKVDVELGFTEGAGG